jgi:hypothetical protein
MTLTRIIAATAGAIAIVTAIATATLKADAIDDKADEALSRTEQLEQLTVSMGQIVEEHEYRLDRDDRDNRIDRCIDDGGDFRSCAEEADGL